MYLWETESPSWKEVEGGRRVEDEGTKSFCDVYTNEIVCIKINSNSDVKNEKKNPTKTVVLFYFYTNGIWKAFIWNCKFFVCETSINCSSRIVFNCCFGVTHQQNEDRQRVSLIIIHLHCVSFLFFGTWNFYPDEKVNVRYEN